MHLKPIATPPSTKQITVPSAQKAATVESLSVLIAPTLALPGPDDTSEGLHFR
jgi:hypothetical protein